MSVIRGAITKVTIAYIEGKVNTARLIATCFHSRPTRFPHYIAKWWDTLPPYLQIIEHFFLDISIIDNL